MSTFLPVRGAGAATEDGVLVSFAGRDKTPSSVLGSGTRHQAKKCAAYRV